MKTTIRTLLGAVLALSLPTLNSPLSTAFAQGSLTPAGVPAPTMKTLDQIEPRRSISSLPYTITQPGSYYLTTNLIGLIGSIVINADNVSLDLNGFTLAAGDAKAVMVVGSHANLAIRNGIIRDFPDDAIAAGTAQNATLEGLGVFNNAGGGIAVGPGGSVDRCQVSGNATNGISAGPGSQIRWCWIADIQGPGVAVGPGSTVQDCIVERNSGDGVTATARCRVADNTSTGNGGAGIRVLHLGGATVVRDNLVVSNATGLQLDSGGNVVSGNIARDNADNYNFAAGNQLDLLLSQVPESIDWPAKVKLAGSLNVASGNAVTIATNGVTLDLNGFTLSSTEASPAGTAILLNNGLRDITICNGHIQGGVTNNVSGVYSGSGFGYGIYYSSNAPVNVLVSRVSVSGCLDHGIDLGTGDSTVVESCTVRTIGSYGIYASTVKSCSAVECGGDAIYGDQVSDCRGESSSGDGVHAETAQNCYGYNNISGAGVSAGTALNCQGSSTYGVGISASTALNCQGSSTYGVGISASTALNCQGGSTTGTGISATYIATSCYGASLSGTGLSAFIANGCHGASTLGTALSTTNNVNSF